MNKTERMYALVEELRAVAPRPRSSSWLARRFEVSTRTIERDLAALLQAGVPIWASTGRAGGYTLDATMTLPPLNFTPSEAAALVTAMAVAGPTPLGSAGRSGLNKIITAMSPTTRHEAGTLIGRIRVPAHSRTNPYDRTATVAIDALSRRRVLDVDYVDRDGHATSRCIEPAALVTLDNHWYLVAWCRLRDQHRAFRLDRIQDATIRLETAPDRPPDWASDAPTPLRQLAIEA